MKDGMRQYLKDLGKQGRERTARQSAKVIREAWPHRHTSYRAAHQIHANVAMIRGIREF